MELKKSKDPWLELMKTPAFVALIQGLTGSISYNAPQEILVVTPQSGQFDYIARKMAERWGNPKEFLMDIKKRNKAVLALDEISRTGVEEDIAFWVDCLLRLLWQNCGGDFSIALRYAFLAGREWQKGEKT